MGNFKPFKLTRHDPEPFANLVGLFIKSNGLERGLLQKAVSSAWDKYSGAAAYTTNKYLRDNILYITVSSSVVRSGLTFQLEGILRDINAALKADELLASCGEVPQVKSIKLR